MQQETKTTQAQKNQHQDSPQEPMRTYAPLLWIAALLVTLVTLYVGRVSSSFDDEFIENLTAFEDPPPMNIPIKTYHVELLLDTSGTMDQSNPRRQAFYAANMFLDALYISDENGGKIAGLPSLQVGVIPYDDRPGDKHKEIYEIRNEADVGKLKDIIKSLYITEGDETESGGDVLGQGPDGVIYNFPDAAGDGGLVDALYEAKERLKDKWPDERDAFKDMIIIFTDGYANYHGTNDSGSPYPAFGDGKDQRLQELLDEVKNFDPPMEIYVIGLNAGPSWPQYQKMANYTQRSAHSRTPPPFTDKTSGVFQSPEGNVNYWLASTVVQVAHAYAVLSAAMIPQTSGLKPPDTPPPDENNETYSLQIHNKGNSALIFYMLSNAKLEHMELEHQVGGEKPVAYDLASCDKDDGWNEHKTVRARWYKGYTTLSVPNPSPGEWTINARGNAETFEAYYVLISDVEPKITVKTKEWNPKQADIELQAYQGQLAFGDRDYYERLAKAEYDCRVRLRDFPGEGQAVTLTAEDHKLIGTFTAEEPGVYRVDFSVTFDGIQYQSCSATVEMLHLLPDVLRFDKAGDKKTYVPKLDGWNETLTIVMENKDGHIPKAECAPGQTLVIGIEKKDSVSLRLRSRKEEKGTGILKVHVRFTTKTAVNQEWEIEIPIVVESDGKPPEAARPRLIDKGHPPD